VIPRPDRLKVFPNPSDFSEVYLSSALPLSTDLPIRIFDINGSEVFRGTAAYSGTEYAYALPDLSFLPKGVYVLEISAESGQMERCKLVRQ
jgi:hypothetical protein